MRRHLLDRPAADDSSARTRAFARIDRAARASVVSRRLQQQLRDERAMPLDRAVQVLRARPA